MLRKPHETWIHMKKWKKVDRKLTPQKTTKFFFNIIEFDTTIKMNF